MSNNNLPNVIFVLGGPGAGKVRFLWIKKKTTKTRSILGYSMC